uniref:Uncharacterized protein n=1 Tax=Anguilla anguilla TaxID=7936 RepID=A0A0E9U940_ANGAN
MQFSSLCSYFVNFLIDFSTIKHTVLQKYLKQNGIHDMVYINNEYIV